MFQKHIAKCSEINQDVPKLPDDKQQILYQEMKRSGQVENPVKYIEIHLEGVEEADGQIKSKLLAKNGFEKREKPVTHC